MSQTHQLVIRDGVLHKRYSSWQRGEHRREWTVLTHLHRHMPGLAPEPLDAEFADVESGDSPALTMREVPGIPLTAPLSSAQMDALHLALTRLWSTPARGLLRRRYHAREAVEAARWFYAHATRPPGIPGLAFDAARADLEQPGLEDVPEIVVGHGDPNLANYLWDGREVRIVDFEDAGISDRAYELGCLVEHLSAHDQDWIGFLPRFDVDLVRLHRSRVLFASLWLYWLLPGNAAAQRNPPDLLTRQADRVLTLIG